MVPFLSRFYERYRDSDWLWIALILGVCCIVMLPIPLIGIPDGYDIPQHLRFVATFQESMLDGSFIPSWAAVDNYGFGSVGIRFYPPLSHYLMAATQMLTKDWYDTLWINAFFWMCLGSFGVYYWAREYLNHAWSAFASLLFATMPYHLMQIYVYMLLAEFAAAAVLSFCFLFATRVINRGLKSDVVLLGISFALLILTHLPSTIIGSVCLGIYCLFLIDWNKWRSSVLNLGIAVCLSLASTAFYSVRVITELSWVQHSDPHYYAIGIYDYSQYLFPMILNTQERIWKKMVILVDIPIFLTFLFLLPPILFFAFRALKANQSPFMRRTFAALSATGVFLIFIESIPSRFVWDSIAILQKIQFPFRFLSVASIVGSLAVALLVSTLAERFPQKRRLLAYSLGSLLFVSGLFTLTQIVLPSEPHGRAEFAKLVSDTKDEPGCRCWWPTWAKSEAFSNTNAVQAGGRSVNILNWQRETREFSVEAGDAGNVRVATFYYPYWKAKINGVSTSVIPDNDGAILIPISGERSNGRLYLEEPYFLGIAKYISLFTWISFLIFFVLFQRAKREQPTFGV
jgi:hypothetical protein